MTNILDNPQWFLASPYMQKLQSTQQQMMSRMDNQPTQMKPQIDFTNLSKKPMSFANPVKPYVAPQKTAEPKVEPKTTETDIIKKFYDNPDIPYEDKKLISDNIWKWMNKKDAEEYLTTQYSKRDLLVWNQPQQPQEWIQDLHQDEWIFEQWIKALPRAIWDVAMWTAEWIGTLWQWATNFLSKVWTDVVNKTVWQFTWKEYTAPQFENPVTALKNELWGKTQDELKPTSVLSDIWKIWAGWSTAAFNILQAPAAVWIATASQLPWTQYITQWIGKVLEWWADVLSQIPWLDKETAQNIITTWMNSLWLKAKWWTIETAWNVWTAFKGAPTLWKGIIAWWKVLAWDTLKSTWEIAKMPYNIAKGTIKWTGKFIGKWVSKWIEKTWIKSPLSQDYVPAQTEAGTPFTIEQTPWLKTNIADKLFNKENEILAQQSVFPKATKEKTPQARLDAAKTALNWIKQLYEDKAKWVVKSDISNMWWWVEWVIEWLDNYGKKIWDLTENKAVVDTADLIAPLKESLNAPFSWVNAWMKSMVTNIVKEFETAWNKASIKDLQTALSNIKSEIFDNRETISKLYKTNTWKALNEFLKNLEERFNTTIENTSWNSAELKQAKTAYSTYKKIQKDLTDSYMVELRNQGKWITWTAWKIAWLYEVLSNPSLSWIFKAIALKEAWETMQYYKSRWWNYETLIRNLDRESIKRNLSPNIPKNDNMNTSTNSSNTDNKEPIKPKPLPKISILSPREQAKIKTVNKSTKPYSNKSWFISPKEIKKSIVGDDLISEAKKYKSADEFVKAQWEFVYHWTNAKFTNYNYEKASTKWDYWENIWWFWFYTTPDINIAKNYWKNIMKIPFKPKNPLDLSKFKSVKELADYLDMSEDALKLRSDWLIQPLNSQSSQFSSNASYLWHDAIIANNWKEIVLIKPKNFKTEAQLKQIYNETNKPKIPKKSN